MLPSTINVKVVTMKFVNSYKNINCGNVLECAFDINKADIKVYRKLE